MSRQAHRLHCYKAAKRLSVLVALPHMEWRVNGVYKREAKALSAFSCAY